MSDRIYINGHAYVRKHGKLVVAPPLDLDNNSLRNKVQIWITTDENLTLHYEFGLKYAAAGDYSIIVKSKYESIYKEGLEEVRKFNKHEEYNVSKIKLLVACENARFESKKVKLSENDDLENE